MMHRVLSTELARGQTVIVYARWLLVLVGLLVAVWNPDSLPQLRIQVGVVLTVAIAGRDTVSARYTVDRVAPLLRDGLATALRGS